MTKLNYEEKIEKINRVYRTNNRCKYSLKHDFFSTDRIVTPEQAYVLGWLSSDGYVYDKDNKYEIVLELKDNLSERKILNKIKEIVNYNGTIIKKTNKVTRKQYIKLRFHSKNMIQDLKKFNIVTKKSLTYTIPLNKINKKVLPYFLRGFFEGDGCIRKNNKTDTYRLTIVSGSKKFHSQWLNYFLKWNLYNVYLMLIKQYDINEFLNYIYKDRFDLVLDRKFKKVQEFFKYYEENKDYYERRNINRLKKLDKNKILV